MCISKTVVVTVADLLEVSKKHHIALFVLFQVADSEISCLHVMRAIIGAGFHLDRVLSNGLLPLDMASTVKDVDSVLVTMLSSVVDATRFSKDRNGFLFSLLNKHPMTISAFITQNQHVSVSTKRDGKSAFDVFSGKYLYNIFFAVVFYLHSVIYHYSIFVCIS